jgi:hypothetical protein
MLPVTAGNPAEMGKVLDRYKLRHMEGQYLDFGFGRRDRVIGYVNVEGAHLKRILKILSA